MRTLTRIALYMAIPSKRLKTISVLPFLDTSSDRNFRITAEHRAECPCGAGGSARRFLNLGMSGTDDVRHHFTWPLFMVSRTFTVILIVDSSCGGLPSVIPCTQNHGELTVFPRVNPSFHSWLPPYHHPQFCTSPKSHAAFRGSNLAET